MHNLSITLTNKSTHRKQTVLHNTQNKMIKNNIKHLYNEFMFLRKTLKMKIQMRSDIPTSEKSHEKNNYL